MGRFPSLRLIHVCFRVCSQLFSVPFTAVTFRHTYAADILTSFTKVMGFAAASGCYFTSGTFLYSANKQRGYGEDRFEQCDTSGMHALKTFIYLLPLYMRFMQNMRQQYDSVQRAKEAKKVAVAQDGVVDKQIGNEKEENTSQQQEEEEELAKEEGGNNPEKTPSTIVTRISHSESLPPEPSLCILTPEDYSTFSRAKRFIFSHLVVWPYSFNALKYFLSMLVVIFGAYPPQSPDSISYQVCYLTLAVISTLYSTYWDFRNDWGLFQMTEGRPLLREKIYYGNTEYFYYIVLFLNPIFRSFWTLSFTPYGHHPFLACFEIFRRSLWACLRMELGYINELKKRSHSSM